MTGPSVSVEDAVDVSTINRYSRPSLLTDQQQRHSLVHILALFTSPYRSTTRHSSPSIHTYLRPLRRLLEDVVRAERRLQADLVHTVMKKEHISRRLEQHEVFGGFCTPSRASVSVTSHKFQTICYAQTNAAALDTLCNSSASLYSAVGELSTLAHNVSAEVRRETIMIQLIQQMEHFERTCLSYRYDNWMSTNVVSKLRSHVFH